MQIINVNQCKHHSKVQNGTFAISLSAYITQMYKKVNCNVPSANITQKYKRLQRAMYLNINVTQKYKCVQHAMYINASLKCIYSTTCNVLYL